MTNFTFILPPKIIFGRDSLNNVRKELEESNSHTPIIPTSRQMVKRENFSKLLNFLKDKFTSVVFNEVEPEPSIETVNRCSEIARENNCDSIIGFGGGSVMDVAKKVGMDLGLFKVMIPTTAGTGSEVTHESVLKVHGNKKAFVDKRLAADVAIVDPSLLTTMPKRLVASSGIDALAHAIESYSAKRGNELTRTLAQKACLIIKSNLKKAVAGDENAILNMALGSLMAGMAFGNSGTALCHALSYPLSSKGIPHGEAVAIMLPHALEFNDFNAEVISEIRKIISDISLPTTFEGDAQEMAKIVMEDERHLSNNPKEVTFEDVVRIYQKVVEGTQE